MMIWAVGTLWAISLLLLLKPFVAQKIGLETLDALDLFAVRQGTLLCLLLFALYPGWVTGAVALIALMPRATFRRGLILVCVSVIGLTAQQIHVDLPWKDRIGLTYPFVKG